MRAACSSDARDGPADGGAADGPEIGVVDGGAGWRVTSSDMGVTTRRDYR